VRFNDILSVKARDSSKPLIVNGISYENALITYDKSIVKENKEVIASKVIKVTKDVAKKEKITQKKDNSNLWIGIAFVVCLFLFLYFKKI
jgi:tRNA A37 threonylcarbamoyladenosine synthetase subunit TsaC/SUA5/YrdC